MSHELDTKNARELRKNLTITIRPSVKKALGELAFSLNTSPSRLIETLILNASKNGGKTAI